MSKKWQSGFWVAFAIVLLVCLGMASVNQERKKPKPAPSSSSEPAKPDVQRTIKVTPKPSATRRG